MGFNSAFKGLNQCISTAGPRPRTGPCHQLYRAARGSPGICHFSFLNVFHEFYSGNILRRIIFVNVSKSYNTRICYRILLVKGLVTDLNVILYLSTCHTVYISVLIQFRGYAVAQLVEALRYKPEGRRFDARWRNWIFSFTSFRPHSGPGVDSACNRNE